MPQDPKERTIKKDGYELTFYPGFASRCTVRGADGAEHELYKQDKPYHLPDGHKKPDTKHKLKLKGGKKKQNITIDIDDPELRIAKITIELYDESHEPGMGSGGSAGETFTTENDAQICPPFCGPG